MMQPHMVTVVGKGLLKRTLVRFGDRHYLVANITDRRVGAFRCDADGTPSRRLLRASSHEEAIAQLAEMVEAWRQAERQARG